MTSLYLSFGPVSAGPGPGPGAARRPPVLRTLLREAGAGLRSRNLTRKQRRSVEEDFVAMERIVRAAAGTAGAAGAAGAAGTAGTAGAAGAAASGGGTVRAVAVFLASGADYEQVVPLPHPVLDRLVVAETPFARPLAAALTEYPYYLVVLADRSRARLLGVHLGRVHPLREVGGEGASGVRPGPQPDPDPGTGSSGGEADERLRAVAGLVRREMGKGDFDGLVLGGPADVRAGLLEELGPSLRPFVAAETAAGPAAAPEEVAGECRALEAAALARRDEELMRRLAEGLGVSGLGAVGLPATLGALRRGAVASLLVVSGYGEPGVKCKYCGFLAPEGPAGPPVLPLRPAPPVPPVSPVCPACGQAGWRPVPDLIVEMADRAVAAGGEVRHIAAGPAAARLRSLGGVAALLRFRLV